MYMCRYANVDMQELFVKTAAIIYTAIYNSFRRVRDQVRHTRSRIEEHRVPTVNTNPPRRHVYPGHRGDRDPTSPGVGAALRPWV